MLKKTLIIYFAIFAVGIAGLQTNVCGCGAEFQNNELAAYLTNVSPELSSGAKFVPVEDGKGLWLQTTATLAFRMIPVEDNVKYRMSFCASQEGLETIEENMRLSTMIISPGVLYPHYQLIFYDRDNKIIKNKSPAFGMPFGSYHEYVHVFYPASGTRFVQLVVKLPAKASKVHLSRPTLLPETGEKAINVNPNFELGPYNYSGWKGFNEADGAHRLFIDQNRKTALFTGFTAFSETFPLMQPGTYRLYQKGSTHIRNNGTHLIFLDSSGKEIRRIVRKLSRSPEDQEKNILTPKEDVIHFVLPKGTTRAHFWIYNTTLYELSVIRVGDERAFQELVFKEAR